MDVSIHWRSKLNEVLEFHGAVLSGTGRPSASGVHSLPSMVAAPKPTGTKGKIFMERRHTGGSLDFPWRSNKPEFLSLSTVSMPDGSLLWGAGVKCLSLDQTSPCLSTGCWQQPHRPTPTWLWLSKIAPVALGLEGNDTPPPPVRTTVICWRHSVGFF